MLPTCHVVLLLSLARSGIKCVTGVTGTLSWWLYGRYVVVMARSSVVSDVYEHVNANTGMTRAIYSAITPLWHQWSKSHTTCQPTKWHCIVYSLASPCKTSISDDTQAQGLSNFKYVLFAENLYAMSCVADWATVKSLGNVSWYASLNNIIFQSYSPLQCCLHNVLPTLSFWPSSKKHAPDSY